MAQTGYTPLQIYSSSTGGAAPAAGNLTNSTLGSELAINITDGKLFYKDNGGSVQVIAWKTTPTTAGGTGLTSYTAGDLLYYASGTALSKLGIGAAGNWLGSSGTAPQWNAPAALTKTDDTNVTLTLGGSASTALLNAASITVGWTGTLAVSRGGTGTGTTFTAGSVVFAGASGVYSQDNSNLFWDDANNRLGVRTATPAYGLDLNNTGGSAAMARIFGNDQANVRLRIENSGGQAYELVGGNPGASNSGLAIYDATAAATRVYLSSTGGVSIGSTVDPGAANLFVGTSGNSGNYGRFTGKSSTADANSNAIYLENSTPARLFQVRSDGYFVTGAAANSPYNNTTGSAANVFVDSSGVLYRSTSSLKYKTNVQDAIHGLNEVLQLRPVTYQTKSEADNQKIFGGFIAEEIDALGLSEFVNYRNDDGTPDAIDYGNMVSLLTKAIQELNKKFDEYVASHP